MTALERAVTPLPVASRHHAGLRRYAPLSRRFSIAALRVGATLMIVAIELLTQVHCKNRRALLSGVCCRWETSSSAEARRIPFDGGNSTALRPSPLAGPDRISGHAQG